MWSSSCVFWNSGLDLKLPVCFFDGSTRIVRIIKSIYSFLLGRSGKQTNLCLYRMIESWWNFSNLMASYNCIWVAIKNINTWVLPSNISLNCLRYVSGVSQVSLFLPLPRWSNMWPELRNLLSGLSWKEGIQVSMCTFSLSWLWPPAELGQYPAFWHLLLQLW